MLCIVDEAARQARARSLYCAKEGDIEGALVHAREAVRLAGEANNPVLVAVCDELLGDVLLRLGQMDEARRQLTSARDRYRQQLEIVGTANVDLSLGELATRCGDPDAAAVHFRAAADGYARAGRPKGEAQALCRVAHLDGERGDIDGALLQCERALALVAGLDDMEAMASARSCRARILLARHPHAAADELQEVLRIYQRLADPVGIANTHLWLMEAAAACHDLARAQVHFRAAVHMFGVIGSPWGETLCWSFNAELLRKHNDIVGAEVALAAAEERALTAGATAAAATSCAARGRLVIARGAVDEGVALLDRARELAASAPGAEVEIHPDRNEVRSALEAWAAIRGRLSPGARFLLDILTALEPTDRQMIVTRFVFDNLWQVLGEPRPLAAYEEIIAELRGYRLVEVRRVDDDVPLSEWYEIAPALIDWAPALVGPERTSAIHVALGQTWLAELRRDADTPGPRTVRAGLGAAIYFKRLRKFTDSFACLEATLAVAKATGEAWHVVPHLYLVVLASGDATLAARLEALEASGALTVDRPRIDTIFRA